MKRLIALGLGAFGLRALLRRRRSRSTQADELREKLAASRAAEPATPAVAVEVEEPAPAPEPEPAAPAQAADPEPVAPPEPDSVDERRAEVHARARQKIDELS